MAKHGLFVNTIGFSKSRLPVELQSYHRNSSPEAISKYSNSGSTTKTTATIHAGIYYALVAYVEAVEYGAGRYAVGINKDLYLAEYESSDGRRKIATYNKKTNIIEGACVSVTGRFEALDLKDKAEEIGQIFFLAMMPALLEDEEALETYKEFSRAYNSTTAVGIERKAVCVAKLCDNIYRRIDSKQFTVNIPVTGAVKVLSDIKVKSGVYAPENLLGGVFSIFSTKSSAGTSSSKAGMKASAAKVAFASFNASRVWSPEEEMLIKSSTARIGDEDVISEEALSMAEYIVGSVGHKKPITNFIWRGETAFGKSYGCEELAKVLNMPLLRITCHPTLETGDFLNKFVPDTASFAGDEIPTFEEIALDPESAYTKLTGEIKEDITPQDCLEVYGEYIVANRSTTPRFKLVESDYVKALANGYIIEIQEPSVIANAGVLTGLNEYNRPGSIITLPDGTTKVRHDNAIVVWTDNVNYEGCRPINQSVLRRAFLAFDSYQMSKEAILARVKEMSGFDDEPTLEIMYDVWDSVRNFCKEQSITDGSTSMEELGNWAQAVSIRGIGALKSTCQQTLISKSTAFVEEQEAIVAACVDIKIS